MRLSSILRYGPESRLAINACVWSGLGAPALIYLRTDLMPTLLVVGFFCAVVNFVIMAKWDFVSQWKNWRDPYVRPNIAAEFAYFVIGYAIATTTLVGLGEAILTHLGAEPALTTGTRLLLLSGFAGAAALGWIAERVHDSYT